MELSPTDIEEIEQVVDAAFLKLCGKTYRHAATSPSERNGHQPPDSWQQIKADFPSLFGKADDAA
jgi:hypothetical protein